MLIIGQWSHHVDTIPYLVIAVAVTTATLANQAFQFAGFEADQGHVGPPIQIRDAVDRGEKNRLWFD